MPKAAIKELTRTVSVSYRWWRDDGNVLPRHVEALENTALERVFEMQRQGFTSGELHDTIHMHGDPEDGVEYRGSWEISKG